MSLPEPAPPPPVTERVNPFQGLAYYEEEAAGRFAGRQRDVEAVVNGILRTRTFVVYGRSGLGKTSLLLAGVFPRLGQQDCQTLAVRLLEDPLGDLRRALLPHAGLETGAGEKADLPALIERAGRGPGGQDRLVVIVFDQFEEFFVRFADQPDPAGGVRSGEELDRAVRQQRIAQREAFIREIGTLAADARLNLRLVFSLREDWIAEMADFADAVPEITHHMFRLLPLTSFGVRQAIVETLRPAGTEVDGRLVSALVDTLAEVHFDPIVLQVLCSEVWERAQARTPEGEPVRLEPRDLEAIGGVRQVFRGYLDQVNGEIEGKDLRRKIHTGAVLDALISEKRTKLAVSRDSLLHQSFAITGEELNEVLDRLVRHRLVRCDPRGGIHWYELVHERLIGAILEWFALDLDFFKFRGARNLVLNSCRNGGWKENPELLLNRGQLDDTVGPYKDLLRFNTEERLFLVSSAIYAHSRDLEFWADLAGVDTSADLIDRFLDQTDNERLRRRAAEAAGRVAERQEHFAGRCLDVALHDASPEVRQAAGRSFADLASAREYQALAERLQEKKNRGAALDVLTETLDKEKIPAGVKLDRFCLWQARQKLHRRRLEAVRACVQARSLRGALIGLGAALVWSLTAGTLLTRIYLFELMPTESLGNPWVWPRYLGLYLLFMLPLGFGTGWLTAWRAATAALRRGREGVTFWMLTGGSLPIICVTLIIAALLQIRVAPPLFSLFGASSPLSLSLEATVFMALALPAVRPANGRRKTCWLWAWTWAFGGALLPLLAVNSSTDSQVVSKLGLWFWLSALLAGPVIYSGLLAVSLTLPRAASHAELSLGTAPREVPVRTRRSRQALGGLLTLFSALLLLHTFGWDGLPFLAHRIVLSNVDTSAGLSPFELQPVQSVENTFHIQLIAVKKTATPRLAEFITEWDSVSTRKGSALVLQPGESRRLAFSPTDRKRVVIRPDRPLSGALPPEGQLVVARLTGKAGVWSGQIPGLESLPGGQPLALSFGVLAQGGEWCRNATLTIHISGVEDEGLNTPVLRCDPGIEEVDFNYEIALNPNHAAVNLILRAWKSVELPAGFVRSATFTPDGLHVATLSGPTDAPSLQIWPLEGSSLTPTVLPLPGPSNEAVFSPNGQWLALLTDREATIREVHGSKRSFDLPFGTTRVLFSPDSALLATDEGSLVKIWKVDNFNKPITEMPFPKGTWKLFTFSPDGKSLATLDDHGTTRIWTLSGEPLEMRLATSSKDEALSNLPPNDLSFSSNGALLVVAAGNLVRIGKVTASPEPFVNLPLPEAVLRAVFSLDGKRLTTLSAETIRILSREGIDARTIGPWDKATFSPDGTRLAVASNDYNVRVWNLDPWGEPIVLHQESKVHSLEFSRDGTHLLTVGGYGSAQVWDLSHPLRPKGDDDIFVFLRVKAK